MEGVELVETEIVELAVQQSGDLLDWAVQSDEEGVLVVFGVDERWELEEFRYMTQHFGEARRIARAAFVIVEDF